MISELEDSALVSILMNCYNCERYLEEAVQSVLNQTYQNWELILWDNQSKDSSSKVYKKFNDTRLKYFFSDKHTDLGGARAKAFKYLKGDYVAVLDSDDLWFPDKLEKQLKLFSNPEVGIVISDTLFFDKNNERPLYGKNDMVRKLLTTGESKVYDKAVVCIQNLICPGLAEHKESSMPNWCSRIIMPKCMYCSLRLFHKHF